MKKILGKSVCIKNIMVLLPALICLLFGGCGVIIKDIKKQIMVVYDYSEDIEKEYDYTNEALANLIYQISDFFLDEERKTDEIPNEALRYKEITVFQSDKKKPAEQQKTDDNRIIKIEIYQYNNELYGKAFFDYADREYSAKLSAEISAQVEALETGGQ